MYIYIEDSRFSPHLLPLCMLSNSPIQTVTRNIIDMILAWKLSPSLSLWCALFYYEQSYTNLATAVQLSAHTKAQATRLTQRSRFGTWLTRAILSILRVD